MGKQNFKIMDDKQWSKFKLRVNVNATVEEAYKAWTTQEGLESWFLRNASFKDSQGIDRKQDSIIQEGDTYTWFWHGYPDSILERGKVLASNGKDNLTFTFSMGCPVNIAIYKEHDETIVQLVESDLPTDEETMLKHFVGDSKGWIFYLANLKSVLEGGLDLRNKKLDITNVITA